MRPLGVGEALDVAFKVYRSNFRVLITIAAVIFIPIGLFSYWILEESFRDSFDSPTFAPVGSTALAAVFVVLLEWLIARSFMQGPTIHTVASVYSRRKPSVGSAFKFALPRLPALIWVQFLIGVGLVGAGFGLSVVLGIIMGGAGGLGNPVMAVYVLVAVTYFVLSMVYVKFSFGPSAVIVERLRGFKAIGRSEKLTKAGFWRIWITLVLAFALTLVLRFLADWALERLMPVASIDSFFQLLRFQMAAEILVNVLVGPYLTVVTVLMYFDSRVRLEALDLSLMTSAIVSGDAAGAAVWDVKTSSGGAPGRSGPIPPAPMPPTAPPVAPPSGGMAGPLMGGGMPPSPMSPPDGPAPGEGPSGLT